MHPFPTPMLMGAKGTMVGYYNVPSPGTSWSVPFPPTTKIGDLIVITIADSNDLNGQITVSNSGGSTTTNFSAQGSAQNLKIYHKVLDSTDIGSGVTVSSTASTICAAVFVFRSLTGPFSGTSSTNNSALSNGATLTVSGYTPAANGVAAMFFAMTRSATFTTDTPTTTWSGRVNGANASFVWQIFDSGYAGQSVSWANVQNMAGWCGVAEELRS